VIGGDFGKAKKNFGFQENICVLDKTQQQLHPKNFHPVIYKKTQQKISFPP
jgi:hypothetical protein